MLLFCLFQPLVMGLSVEKRTLICPITNRPFQADIIPARTGSEVYRGVAEADMGTDSDGCRHTSGISEYALFVVTSPWSYFSALSIEWDERGRFRGFLPQGFSEWIRGRDGFNSELVMDRGARWRSANERARAAGEPAIPPLADWEMPQSAMPVEQRYRLAIASYVRRRFPSSTIAKVALNGAWAVRMQMNRPIFHARLAGGYEEVDHRLQRHVTPGEEFNLEKWVAVYRDIFHNARLTDAGFFVAGNTYLGLQLRVGDMEGVMNTLDRLQNRFANQNRDGFDALRVLVRGQRTLITQSYIPFLEQAGMYFKRAMGNEEIPRPRLPEAVLAVAESHRRLGQNQSAMAWYTTLARMSETQPQIRREIRAAEAVPNSQAPYLLMLGWRADEQIAALRRQGVEYHEDPVGPDAELTRVIIHQGLGSENFTNPRWEPVIGGDRSASERLLDLTGKAVLDYHFRVGTWPNSLDSMWVDGYVRDRNAMNRFHCPVSGERFRYLPVPDPAPPNTVLVATAKPVPGSDGPRYGVFLANNTIRWVEEPMLPGEILSPASGR
ncbi:MAG: hypothetical protein EA402_09265 [Planctomycetota bacterium]|nr:MAG: hypothetical protein EA402_09265 [Planctomycetota bacterium]